MKARNRQSTVEFVILEKNEESVKNVMEFMGFKVETSSAFAKEAFSDYCRYTIRNNGFRFPTSNGHMMADIGDYIVKNENGDFYAYDASDFEKTFDVADEAACKYCDGSQLPIINHPFINDKGVAMKLPNELFAYGYNIYECDSAYLVGKINYCPKCGRKLEAKK